MWCSAVRRHAVALATLGVVLLWPAVAPDVNEAHEAHAAAEPHAEARARQPQGARRVVEVVAERFLFVPSEITVDEGTTLEIHLTSEDTDHGFRIIDSDVNVVIPKRGRGEAVATFEATTPGDYTFECSQMCGAGHSFMRGSIRVKPRAAGPPAGGGAR